MTTIITALIFLSIIIMIHEFGHFIIGKWVGISADEFSIGMGPRLFKFTGKETVYSLRLLPIGGYVKFLGEDEGSSDPRAFNNAKVWKRMAVIFSGPLMNFVLAILLLSILFLSYGVYEAVPIIANVVEGSPFEQAGLKPGDQIVKVNGNDMTVYENSESVERIRQLIMDSQGQSVSFSIMRGNELKEYNVTPRFDEESRKYMMGFSFDSKAVGVGFFESIRLSVIQTGRIIGMMVVMLKDLIFQGRGLNDVMGPVGIVGEIGKAAQEGIQQLLSLGIIITINLAIINLLPFPALDGGRLTLLAVEGIRGKPIDPKKEGYFHLLGFVLLMIIMVLVTFKDIFNR